MQVKLTVHSGRLYRIMRFERVVQIFESRSIFFAHPSTWEDPYETQVKHPLANQVFGQCWCTRGVSDAMWRIYSPDRMGVRISTTTKKLRTLLKPDLDKRGLEYREGLVNYHSQHFLQEKVRKICSSLRSRDPS